MNQKIDIKPNIIDRVVEAVDPRAGLKRRQARAHLAIVNSYVGASKKKRSLRKWRGTTGDADTDLEFDRDTLIERSRDLERNNPIAGGAINNVCLNVVGGGLRLDSRIDRAYLKKRMGMTETEADRWEEQAEREFDLFAGTRECDLERIGNFYEKQELAFRQVLVNGDSIILTPRMKRKGSPYQLKLQMVEADRLCNKNNTPNGPHGRAGRRIFDGVVKDQYGAPVEYHISRGHPGSLHDFNKSMEWDTVKAFGDNTGLPNVLHLFRQLRPGQSRGVPYLAPVIEPLRVLGEYTEAELMAAVVAGMYTVFITTEDGDSGMGSEPDMSPGGKSQDKESDTKLGYGAIIDLAENERIESANPGRPNTAFDPFVASILKQVAIGLELPYEILMKCYQSSYSASKAAFLDAWRFFRSRRTWLATNLCRPIYEIWMYEAVASGRLYAPGFFDDHLIRRAYLGSQWIGPAPGHLDPLKEMAAAEKRVKALRISTRRREALEYSGDDYNDLKTQIRKEEEFERELEQIGAEEK